MKYHENHQKRAAVSSQNWCFLKGLAPTSKSMVSSHLDPMWPPSATNPGGMWVLVCVCVCACACVPVCPLLTHLFFFSRRIENMQGTGFEAKRIVPALPGIAPASSRHPPGIGHLSVYMYVYIFICVYLCACVCMCVYVCVRVGPW